MNVLIVEDDDGVAEALQQALGVHGYRTDRVDTGGAALDRLSEAELVLLDLALPDLDGHEVCRRIRAVSCVPVIALSGRSEELDRVMVLHLGADDFVAKPFSRYELVARIQAVSRRAAGCPLHPDAREPAATAPLPPQNLAVDATVSPTAGSPTAAAAAAYQAARPAPDPQRRGEAPMLGVGHGPVPPLPAPPPTPAGAATPSGPPADARGAPAVLSAGPLQLDPRARKVHLHDEEVRITRKEFDLLVMLMEEPGAVMERQDIMSRVWDENWFGSTRTLDVHVGSLRTKLGSTEWIETVRGVGYRLTVPAVAQT